MKYIAAYLLAQLGGNATPDKAAITKILSSVGANVDEKAIDSLLEKLSGKDISELIKEGASKLAVVGGGSSAPAAGSGPAAEEKQEEKKEEEEVVELGGGFDDLFD